VLLAVPLRATFDFLRFEQRLLRGGGVNAIGPTPHPLGVENFVSGSAHGRHDGRIIINDECNGCCSLKRSHNLAFGLSRWPSVVIAPQVQGSGWKSVPLQPGDRVGAAAFGATAHVGDGATEGHLLGDSCKTFRKGGIKGSCGEEGIPILGSLFDVLHSVSDIGEYAINIYDGPWGVGHARKLVSNDNTRSGYSCTIQ